MNQFKSLIDAISYFSDEKNAVAHLHQTRWEEGKPVCPYCAHEKVYRFSDGIYFKCASCRKRFTARVGSIFEDSNIKMGKWYIAIYLVTAHKKGISSYQLARDISVTQKTAWFILHRIRYALGIDDQKQLEGTIQLDETFVGGKNKNRHADKKVKGSQGRSFKDKTPVLGMLQQEVSETKWRPHKTIEGEWVKEKVVVKPSYVRCRVVTNTNRDSIQPIILDNVATESKIVSDEWNGYRGLDLYYNHRIVDHTAYQYVNEDGDTTNHLEGFWTLFKKAYHGVYHYMSRKHLQHYADESAFRYNTREMKDGERLNFASSLARVGSLKYKQLVGKAA